MAVTTTVSGNFTLNFSWTELASLGVQVQNVVESLLLSGIQIANNNTGALTADCPYAAQLTLAGATATIDLTNLTSPGGTALDMARVRLFVAYNSDTTAGHDVKIEAGATNGWAQLPASTSPNFVYANGGLFVMWDPNSTSTHGLVVGASSKTITFDPGANTISPKLQVFILGGSSA